MRIPRLSPKSRTRFLAFGLFLIGLSSTASLISPQEPIGSPQVLPAATLAADVAPTAKTFGECSAAG